LKRTMILLTTLSLVFALACSGDDAKEAQDAASDAAASAQQSASDTMNEAGAAANAAAEQAKQSATELASDAVAACRGLAESGNWGQALEVCKKAHEMLPDDLAIEHAYQQAQAAAAN